MNTIHNLIDTCNSILQHTTRMSAPVKFKINANVQVLKNRIACVIGTYNTNTWQKIVHMYNFQYLYRLYNCVKAKTQVENHNFWVFENQLGIP